MNMAFSMDVQVARGQIEHSINMRQRLTAQPLPTTTNPSMESTRAVEFNLSSVQLTSTPLPAASQPVISLATSKTTEEDYKKAAAAAVAAKLAASTSSAQMLTSVLSSLVAEEAASLSGGLKSTGFTAGLPMFSPEKRPKLDKQMPVSDVNSSELATNDKYATCTTYKYATHSPSQPDTSTISTTTPSTTYTYCKFPSKSICPICWFDDGVMPYGYGANNLPPPPPLSSHMAMGLARPVPQPPPQPLSQQQQPPANSGYYRPPGIGFYGQSHQPTPPPVPRQ
ncbi:unnamed protein product [Ilex paraguariensis]|uniref:Uncharacterized protein n=1 Tax=Ilex paraguariensis TaxID=185542 RepID=A0ABC8U9C1_9AQUA